MSGPVVKNHVSSKMLFVYDAILRTTFRSWSRVYLRLLLRQARLEQHLRHHHRRKAQDLHMFQRELNVRVQTTKNGETRQETQSKNRKQKMEDHETNWETRQVPKYQNGCKNSGKISWMEAFLNLMEPEFLFSVTHTRALPINPL